MKSQETIINKFNIPEVAAGLLEFFFTEDDLQFIYEYEDEPIGKEEFDKRYPDYREDAFSRGVISKVDESGSEYVLNDFYGLLDVFVVSELEKYRSLPTETRKEIDEWYFRQYADGLDDDLSGRPTSDKVLSFEEMMDFIDSLSEPLYLSNCDCKSLGGECGSPTRTCINYAPGLNSFAARGISQPITKEEAKDVIRMADDHGLVHTISDHGICNCCDDCCYLFRAQKERGSVGLWPESKWIINIDEDKCVGCRRCETRCRFGALNKDFASGKQQVDTSKCIGCGLCRKVCNKEALGLVNRRT